MWDPDHSRMQPQGSNYAITRPRCGDRNANVNSITTTARLIATAAILLLAACTGGGSVNIGSGQSADPGTVDFPIAYVKRTIPEDPDDLRQQRDTLPNADLFFRDRASPSAIEVNITERITGADDRFSYDIKDVDVSPNGKRIIFSLRGPLGANQDEEEAPFWEIWEYNIAADGPYPANDLHRIIASDVTASEGNDIGPQYLPDGRIVFTSTRQRQSKAVLLDESKAGFAASVNGQFNGESAFLLHVMDADGGNIHQITFNQAHDLWPSVLADGRVLFTRWDGATGRGMHLYTANPDGTDMQLLYGSRSHQRAEPPDVNGIIANSTVQFVRPREMSDGRILTMVRPFTNSDFGGDLVMIDTRNYVENTQPLASSPGLTGPAQTRVTPNEISTIAGPSLGGRFLSAFPLWDGSNRILVSWSQCRLLDSTVTPTAIVPCTSTRLADPNAQTAPPLYSAFVFDPADNTFKPLFVPVEGVMITDLVAAQPRVPPVYRADHVLAAMDFDPALVSQSVGVLEIRSVYDFDGNVANAGAPDIATVANPSATGGRTADQRPARFLRIEKAVSIGDDDLGFPDIEFNDAVGSGVGFMREILGYAPIEPDGSVSVRVPANVAFVISVLDDKGRRLPQFQPHRNWLQIRPGEIRRCNGCHVTSNTASHGRDGTFAPVAWAGAPFPATLAATAASAQAGDTMAQARTKSSCVSGSTCSQVPSVNLTFDDVWTDPVAAGRAADASFSYTYGSAGGFNTPPPVRNSCMSNWSATCRIIINYTQHIQPLWDLPRGLAGANTCTNCHAPADANGVVQLPAGQLELISVLDPDVANGIYMKSYTELTRGDNAQAIVGGALVDLLVDGPIDPVTGLPTQVTVPVARTLNPGNARGSAGFFDRFATGGGTINHTGLLTDSELRLISEWVDIGAQYFNNPIGLPDAFLD
jgi:hypothetical protein